MSRPINLHDLSKSLTLEYSNLFSNSIPSIPNLSKRTFAKKASKTLPQYTNFRVVREFHHTNSDVQHACICIHGGTNGRVSAYINAIRVLRLHR